MGSVETVKKSFIAGVALIAPLLVTLVAVQILFGWLRGILDPIIQQTGLAALTANVEIVAELVALIVLVLAIAVLGYVAQRSAGQYVFGMIDRLVGLIPMVSVVYNGVRQVSDALTKRQNRFESVVLVEHPREGIYAFGFVTAGSPKEAITTIGRDAFNVYLPNSPNPTQGKLAVVPEDQVHSVDISVSRAIRLLVTTGIAEEPEEMEQIHEDVREELGEEDIDLEDAF